MKIFFYQATTAFPSPKSYEWIGGENNKVFFSHGIEFDKAIITPSLPLNLKGSERVYLIPEGWKAQFLALLNEKYGNRIEASVEHPLSPESKPPKEEIGSGWTTELATFYEQSVTVVGVFTVKPKAAPPIPIPLPKLETCRMQFKSMVQGLLSAMDDPKRLGIMVALLVSLVSVMVARYLSAEHHGNRIKLVEDALLNNPSYIPTLRDEWQQEGIRERDNPALIVLMEIEKATPDFKKGESPSSANSTPTPPPRCYIVQSGEGLKKVATKFCGDDNEETIKKIVQASIQENANKKVIYYQTNTKNQWGKLDVNSDKEMEDFIGKYNEKTPLSWELVVSVCPNGPKKLLVDCHFSPSAPPP